MVLIVGTLIIASDVYFIGKIQAPREKGPTPTEKDVPDTTDVMSEPSPIPTSIPTPIPSVSSEVRGVYILGPRDREKGPTPAGKDLLDNTDISGISLRFRWEELELEEGNINTDMLRSEIRRVSGAGKQVMLRVIPGAGTPDWVFGKGVPSLSWQDESRRGGEASVRIPVPWNETYLLLWQSFISRLGGALRGEKNSVVLVHGTGANSLSGEMGLEQGYDGGTAFYFDERGKQIAQGNLDELWIHYGGYSRERILEAWRKSLSAWASAFPHAKISLNLVPNILKKDGMTGETEAVIKETVILFGKRLTLQNNALKDPCMNPDCELKRDDFALIGQYRSQLITGFQMLGVSGDCARTGDLGPALQYGVSLGADYFELYKGDLMHYNETIRACSNFLLQNSGSCATEDPFLCKK